MLSKTFSPLSIGSVKPKGILKEYLQTQWQVGGAAGNADYTTMQGMMSSFLWQWAFVF